MEIFILFFGKIRFFGKFRFFNALYTPEEKRGSQTKEAAKDTRWVPREGLPKSQAREVPKSTFGLTDKHKYVKMDKGTVDLRKPKQLPKWKDGNTFFDAYTKNFDE